MSTDCTREVQERDKISINLPYAGVIQVNTSEHCLTHTHTYNFYVLDIMDRVGS